VHTLDALFYRLPRFAVGYITQPESVGAHLKLALKSQSQCQLSAKSTGPKARWRARRVVAQCGQG